MDKLTLKIEYSDFLDKFLINYLEKLDGVKAVKINNVENEVYVEYNSNIISPKVLSKETLLYLDLIEIPSIIAFNKHSKCDAKKDNIVIKDLCCEYCLKGMIEDLFEIDGIISAYSDFDYKNKSNVSISITYDENKIDKEKIKELEKQFNSC